MAAGDGPRLRPASLLVSYSHLFDRLRLNGPILDLACGSGHNGLFLARKGFPVVLCDRSGASLQRARAFAHREGVKVDLWQVDLEKAAGNPLEGDHYGAIIVFRYLHRPLIPCIRKAIKGGGLLFYETFTREQARFGRPKNPRYLLKPFELKSFFEDWKIYHYFEGILDEPRRAIAQIICQKPEQ
ncbi:MAG: methyltransferase domain-containing protein [Deltaproteobacteria bacterium]|nr:methyltransferase domain-containing protein [Deltaproteobacteria bacterium]